MKKRTYILLSLLAGACIFLYYLLNAVRGEYFRTYSPDLQYSVYASAYICNSFSMAMPGHGSDGRGKIFLYDEVEKKIIHSAKISILWTTSEIRWEENAAYYIGEDYPHILDPWRLPRKIKMPYYRDFPDGIRRKYSSFDKLIEEWQSREINGISRLESERYFDADGNVTIENEYTYYPEKVKDRDIWSVVTQKFYENGQLTSIQNREGYERSSGEKCGTWIKYDRDGNVIEEEFFGDCANHIKN